MKNRKVIILAEISILPEYLEEIKALSAATLAPTLLEPGCEAFYQTSKDNVPNTLIFFEVFNSKAAHDVHLAADYTRNFFDGVQGKLSAPPVKTSLITLADL